MRVSIIAAIGKNRELGKNNKLLWSIPEDLRHFRDITTGHTVIMGRKTFESIGKSLPNRINIVITRNPKWTQKGVVYACSVQDALTKARTYELEEVFIIGGGQIYEQALPLCDRLYLTFVDASYPGADTFFPHYEDIFQRIVSRREVRSEKHRLIFEIRER